MKIRKKIKNTILLRKFGDYVFLEVFDENGKVIKRSRYRGSLKDIFLQRFANRSKKRVIFIDIDTTKTFKPKFKKEDVNGTI